MQIAFERLASKVEGTAFCEQELDTSTTMCEVWSAFANREKPLATEKCVDAIWTHVVCGKPNCTEELGKGAA